MGLVECDGACFEGVFGGGWEVFEGEAGVDVGFVLVGLLGDACGGHSVEGELFVGGAFF